MPQMGPLPWMGVSVVVFLVLLGTVNYLYFLTNFSAGRGGLASLKPWWGWDW